MLGKIEGMKIRGQQNEKVGWHHRLNRHESEQAPAGGDGQGGLACCSPRGHRVRLNGMTEQQKGSSELTVRAWLAAMGSCSWVASFQHTSHLPVSTHEPKCLNLMLVGISSVSG